MISVYTARVMLLALSNPRPDDVFSTHFSKAIEELPIWPVQVDLERETDSACRRDYGFAAPCNKAHRRAESQRVTAQLKRFK